MGLVALALLAACASDRPPPDLLLVTLDTTRADAVGAYGALPSPTPVLDALAAHGVVFHEAMSPAPLTLPAHTSLLTGLWPDRTGVRGNGVSVAPDLTSVAERLQAAGWDTAAFVSAAVLDTSLGLSAGFAAYDDPTTSSRTRGPVVPSRPASATNEALFRWLLGRDPRDPRPVFVWLHYYDAHLPNSAHDNGFDDPYLSEVAFADRALGEALTVWTQNRPTRNLPDPWGPSGGRRTRDLAVIVVADHGEGRGDHGELTHGLLAYRSTLRVPLVVVAPGRAPGVEERVVSTTDVAPTLLAMAGLPPADPGSLDGRDLFGPTVPDRVVYGETWVPREVLGFSELRVAQDANERFVEAPRPERYRWPEDPDEELPLSDAGSSDLAHWLARRRAEARRPDAGATPSEVGEALEALGYVDAPGLVPPEVPFAELPDPKDHPGALEEMYAAIHSARSRPPAEGVPILRAALERYPRSGALCATLAQGLRLTGALDEAWDVLDQAWTSGGTNPFAAVQADLRMEQGRLDEAMALAIAAARDRPEAVNGALVQAEVLRRRLLPEEALSTATAALTRFPDHPGLLTLQGAALADLRRFDEAAPVLERALALDEGLDDTRFLLALVQGERGDLPSAALHLEVARSARGADPDVDLALARVRLLQGQGEAAGALVAPWTNHPTRGAEARELATRCNAATGAPDAP